MTNSTIKKAGVRVSTGLILVAVGLFAGLVYPQKGHATTGNGGCVHCTGTQVPAGTDVTDLCNFDYATGFSSCGGFCDPPLPDGSRTCSCAAGGYCDLRANES